MTEDKWGYRDSRTLEEIRAAPLNIKGYFSFGVSSSSAEIDPETGKNIGEPVNIMWVYSKPGPLSREVRIISTDILDAIHSLKEALNGAIKAFEENWTVDTGAWREVLENAEKLLPTFEENPTDDKAA